MAGRTRPTTTATIPTTTTMIMGTTTITAMTITPRIAAPFDAVGRPDPGALTTLMAWYSG